VRRLHDDASSALRRAARIALSSYVLNGLVTAIGIPFASIIVGYFFGSVAAATAGVGVIVATPPDQVSPKRGKLGQLLPALVLGIPLFFAVQLLRSDPLELSVLIVAAAFFSFLGAAWGKRGIPISIAVLFSMIFGLAVPQALDAHGARESTLHFALGMVIYLVYALAVNAALNRRYRVLVLVDALLLVSRLMRAQARQFRAQGNDAAFLAGLIKVQAGLSDQLQASRNLLLESPTTPRRQQLAAILLQILDMRDHLAACALDIETLKREHDQRDFLRALGDEVDALAAEVEALADGLLLWRKPESFQRTLAEPPEGTSLLARSLAGRVRHIHEEVERMVAIARGEREPDVAIVRAAWQLFVSPTAWSWKPFMQLWSWDAPPLRHAIRGALAIAVGQAVALVLPWGTHDYWVLLTIVVVLRGSFAQTIERRNNRVAGTIIGCTIAGALLFAHTPAGALLAVVTLAQAIAHGFAIRRYLVTAIAASVLALLQAHQLNAEVSPVFEAGERLGDTFIGVVIAWVFSYVLPSWERGQIPSLVARVLKAQAKHAQEALALGQLTAVDNRAELAWRLARREVYDSISALAQAAQRAVAEPRAVQPPLETLERVLASSYQLLAQLTAVKTMLLQRRDRLRIDEIRGALKDASDKIASALSKEGSPELPPAPPNSDTAMKLPDPFEQDLSPWLVRRLQLAQGLAQELHKQAALVR